MTMLSSLFSRARASAGARLESTTMMSSLKLAARMTVRALALLWMLLAIGLPAQAANNAAFGGQSLPTAMTTGGTYTATVIMTNNGTTTWTPGGLYRLGSQNPSDNYTWMTANRVLLTSSVAPGQNGTFVFQVTAPSTPGTYNFQWEMVQDFVEWFGVLTPNLSVVVSAPAPVNGAQVTGTSVPATMTQGQSYAMTVTMKNTGTTTWAGGGTYSLGTTNPFDNLVWGVKRAPITSAVAPGQQATFNIVVVAPAAGSYVMNWGMVQEFVEWFGPSSSSAVTVSAPPAAAPTMGVSRNPSPMTAGQAYTLTWSSTNATSVSRVCTAASTGYTVNDAPGLNGSSSGTASTAWVGNPSSCVWRATGAGGTATFNETMTTNAAPSVEVVTYIHTDGLGSPVARTNASGQLVASTTRTRYEPYGLTAAGTTPTIGFTGHVNDADTGLVYMQQRYYDPVAGRFLSIDPVTTDADTGDSFNRYGYANNNPYRYFDKDGRESEPIPTITVFPPLPIPLPPVIITAPRPKNDPNAIPDPSLIPSVGPHPKENQLGNWAGNLLIEYWRYQHNIFPFLNSRIDNPTKAQSPVWQNLENAGNGRKKSGKGSKTRYHEWDNTHNDIEVYNNDGKHLGSMEPTTGEMYKDPVPGRKIDL